MSTAFERAQRKHRTSVLSWREAMIAAAANARARQANCEAAAADPNVRPVDRAESAGRACMANWLASDFEYAAQMAPHEGAEYVRKMGTPDSRAIAAEKGKATQGYGARRKREAL